ncbi:MAG: response regulator, partial [Azonexus sp.]
MQNFQTRPIRVMLVDDLQIVSWGLAKLVQTRHPHMELAGLAVDAASASAIIYRTPVDIIVIDLDGDIGVDSIAELSSISPARMLALTASRDVSLHDNAILAGARGVVAKSEPVEALLMAIEKVH